MKLSQRYISLILLVFLLAPSVIQLLHIIAEEHYNVATCLSQEEQYYSSYDIECDLCKFHLNDFSVTTIALLPSIVLAKITILENFFYVFKSEVITSFYVRGPPLV